MAVNGADAPKITLYTNHGCPYAHRAHITLHELGLDYDEVLIDLEKPREPWYLKVNPRGLVPSLKYTDGTIKDEIITESAVVSQFLIDSHPSHLLPLPSDNPKAPLTRARMNFFVDTFNTKVADSIRKIMLADSSEEKEKLGQEYVQAVAKEIEPLLEDAAPFFGGSKKLTYAETQTAPWVIRTYTFAKTDLYPKGLTEGLNKLPNFSKWAAALQKEESVTYVWDEEQMIKTAAARVESYKQRMKARAT